MSDSLVAMLEWAVAEKEKEGDLVTVGLLRMCLSLLAENIRLREQNGNEQAG